MASAIVKDDEVIYAKGFGVKRLGNGAGRCRYGLPDRIDLQGLDRVGGGDAGRRPGSRPLPEK